MALTIQELLQIAVEKDASDLHITTHIPPRLRIHGQLISIDHPPLSPAETKTLIYSLLTDRQKKMFEEKMELDFSFGIQDLGRFRANVFMQKGAVAAAIRRFMPTTWSFEQLGLPRRLSQLCHLPRGLVLVTGPTGSGKSTTLACMIDHISKERPVHIVTIEDPIEYFFTPNRAVINQRELHMDTLSFPLGNHAFPFRYFSRDEHLFAPFLDRCPASVKSSSGNVFNNPDGIEHSREPSGWTNGGSFRVSHHVDLRVRFPDGPASALYPC